MNEYKRKNYITIDRLMAYIEQYKYINDNKKVFEIGNGGGVFKDLANKICYYKVADINKETQPDYILDIVDFDSLKKFVGKFDIIFCCQVLEHMPLEKTKLAFKNILKLNAEHVIISIPDVRKRLKFNIEIPKFRIKKNFSIPFTGKTVSIDNHPCHHWAICSKNRHKIYKIFNDDTKQYILEKEYRLFERPSQHFFIYKKK